MNLVAIGQSYLNLLPVTLLQGMIYAFVAMGIMIPFRLLSFPDLTAEGAFPFGGSVAAACIAGGLDPLLATLAGAAAGFIAGAVTAGLHVSLKLNTLLCGILVLTMLFSIDIRIMGKPNIALFAYGDIFQIILDGRSTDLWARIGLVFALVLLCGTALHWLLRTQAGLALRAVGASQTMARAQGISVSRMLILGVGLAGCFSGLGGAIVAQNQSFADVNMGFGVLVNGLASLIIGEQIVGRSRLAQQIVAPVAGALIYFQLLSLALSVGLQPSDLKLFTGLLVIALLALPRMRTAFSTR
jgi:putative ABC transport system permease protein